MNSGLSSPDTSFTETLWGYYPVFRKGQELAILHPVAMRVVYLDEREYSNLIRGNPNRDVKAVLSRNFIQKINSEPWSDLIHHVSKSKKFDEPDRISGVRVVLTDACNMKCTYCFVETNRNAITFKIDDLMESLEKLLSGNRGRESFNIQWFGGEPLIRFDLMSAADKFISKVARRYGIGRVARTLVTNGVVLRQEHIQHFRKYHYHVGFSYDGRAATDTHRSSLAGRNVTEKIKMNMKSLAWQRGVFVGMNITPTSESIRALRSTIDEGLSCSVRFFYINTPITRTSRWNSDGRALAEALFDARLYALSRGAMVFSLLDRIYQALDTQSPRILDHIQGDGGINAALLPGGKISLCDVNWQDQGLVIALAEVEQFGPQALRGSKKALFSHPQCRGCFANSVCGGPPRSEYIGEQSDEDIDEQYCRFIRRSLELIIWDGTGLQ